MQLDTSCTFSESKIMEKLFLNKLFILVQHESENSRVFIKIDSMTESFSQRLVYPEKITKTRLGLSALLAGIALHYHLYLDGDMNNEIEIITNSSVIEEAINGETETGPIYKQKDILDNLCPLIHGYKDIKCTKFNKNNAILKECVNVINIPTFGNAALDIYQVEKPVYKDEA